MPYLVSCATILWLYPQKTLELAGCRRRAGLGPSEVWGVWGGREGYVGAGRGPISSVPGPPARASAGQQAGPWSPLTPSLGPKSWGPCLPHFQPLDHLCLVTVAPWHLIVMLPSGFTTLPTSACFPVNYPKSPLSFFLTSPSVP